jgi:hypothetical protein
VPLYPVISYQSYTALDKAGVYPLVFLNAAIECIRNLLDEIYSLLQCRNVTRLFRKEKRPTGEGEAL